MSSGMIDTRGQNQMAPKQAYEKPTVITFGTVAKLTLTKGSNSTDGASQKGARIP